MLNPKSLRKEILTMAFDGQSVHIGCAFSLVEIFAVLYKNFSKGNSILLSKGHGVMAQYACLAELDVIEKFDLKNYFKDGSRLKGLAEADIKGINISSGSLGHGLSVAVGLALASKLKKENQKFFCIVGDGESNEGSIWEAIMFAAQFKLSNLVVIIDSNKFQAMGKSVDVMNMESFKEKFLAFGFDCEEINGHDEDEIQSVIHQLLSFENDRPKAIIAHTIKGKGVSFMENNNSWHYTRLDKTSYQKAMMELGE
jgi:transketolase